MDTHITAKTTHKLKCSKRPGVDSQQPFSPDMEHDSATEPGLARRYSTHLQYKAACPTPPRWLCWSHSKSGAYSVKSGYDLAMELKQGEENAPISEPSTKWLKAKVWKVKAPSKIKHFLWQSISNCLPFCDRLVERHCGHDRQMWRR